MADRILVWHEPGSPGADKRIGPTFYIEADYKPAEVRLHAEYPPVNGDMEVTIYDDGVSIFENHSGKIPVAGVPTYISEATTAVLPKGQTKDDNSGEFATKEIAEGSWVHCIVTKSNGARNITVQLELEKA